ncbi:MAG: PQQ-binding-like beta-propeller repeat protein [Planctomycetes bacterium]|nr:PQQ-binding-like beta-propeller repeat protein [Planctomycetota bacterium]
MTTFNLIMFAVLCSAGQATDRAKAIAEQAGFAGGLIVHVGCGDGALTEALSMDGRFVVQGLAVDAAEVARAREEVRTAGSYGRVSIRLLGSGRLPYGDEVVNVIVDEVPGTVSDDEALRVLVPGGVHLTAQGDGWKKTVKPGSEETDEWTHFLYDATNNAVSRDRVVGPPKSLRWACGPEYARSHEHLGSVSAMVTANGRVFYIVDEGPIANVHAPPDWKLVARDAYNGILLWTRPIGVWESHLRGFRSGPVDIARRLTVHGDRLYAAPSMGDGVVVLDAATGAPLRTLTSSDGVREILIDDGMVFVVADDMKPDGHRQRRQWFEELAPKLTHYEYPRAAINEFGSRRLIAYSEETGEVLWQKSDQDAAAMLPTVTAVTDGAVCLHTATHLICLDRSTGQEKWRTERLLPVSRVTWSTPTLVIAGGVVLVGDRANRTPAKADAADGAWVVENSHKGSAMPAVVIAYDIKDGRQLWQAECFENYDCPFDIFVLGDVVWTGKVLGTRDPGFVAGRDLRTGEVVAQMESDLNYFVPGMGHHRCYRNKATERFLLTGRSGIEFIEPATGRKIAHHWVRGTCQYGVMPANGLTIAPPHSCACHITGKLVGMNALSAKSEHPAKLEANEARLEKGPAYAQIANHKSPIGNSNDWPLYRKDARRSGATAASIPPTVQVKWCAKVGASITPPIVADGKVFCVDKDTHTVMALNDRDGSAAWQFVAEGRVDSPPSYDQGRLVFGASSGHVYCLDASTGALAWRFRAAPTTAQIVSRGQLESLWPVHGSVLIRDNRAYFAAGRSSFLDGGILLYAVDVATGKVVASRRFDSLDPESREQPKDIVISFNYAAPRVALPDILSADGDDIFMRQLRFDSSFASRELDKKHLYSSAGLLDSTWWHRTYWQYGTTMGAGYHGWHLSGNQTPAGRILVFDDQHVFGYGRKVYDKSQGGHMSEVGPGHHLFCEPLNPPRQAASRKPGEGKPSKNRPLFKRSFEWSVSTKAPVVAMALTSDVLYIATTPKPWAEQTESGEIVAVDRTSGKVLRELPLPAASVFDGMAAATGSLYIALRDGRIACLATP